MTRIIFFDTETTNDEKEGRLCQLGVKELGIETPVLNEMYKPPVPVSYESMAVHHITEKMLEGKPSFIESNDYSKIKELFENKEVYSVAHNARFDVTMLGREKIVPANVICTMKVAQTLDNNDHFANYRLQYLRYASGIEITGVNAHDAWGDVVVLEALFEKLFAKMVTLKGSEQAALDAMVEISKNPSLIKTIRFGKHSGKKVSELVKEDRGYLEWLLKQKRENPDGEEDWIWTLEDALGIPHAEKKVTLWD